MLNYESMLKKADGVNEESFFNKNGDSISVLSVILNGQSKYIGIVRVNDEINYLECFSMDNAASFFKKCEQYCTNNVGSSYFRLVNELKDRIRSKEITQYLCEFNEKVYTVYPNRHISGKCVFKPADFIMGSDRRAAALQLFLTLGFSKVVIEVVKTPPITVCNLSHNGGNDVLSYVMNSVSGRRDICEIKIPNELLHNSKLENNNVFCIKEIGKKFCDFSECLNELGNNLDSYLFTFSHYAFPFDTYAPQIKFNALMIQENFGFTQSDTCEYYSKIDGTNYLAMFKSFISGKEIKKWYDKIYRTLSSNAEFCKDLQTREKMIYMTATVRITAVLMNKFFSNLKINAADICKLLIEFEKAEVDCEAYNVDKIMVDIIKSVDKSKVIESDDTKKGKGRLSKEEFAIPYDDVVNVLKKSYPGKSHIAILSDLYEKGYIHCGAKKRSDGIPKFDSCYNGETVIRFWRFNYEENYGQRIQTAVDYSIYGSQAAVA